MQDLDLLIDAAVTASEIETGGRIARISRQAATPIHMMASQGCAIHTRQPRWTADEDDFLRKKLGYLTDAEIGSVLGRSANAVHLRWSRDLELPGPSKDPRFLTGQQAAKLTGLDQHKITYWCDAGMIPCRIMAGGRYIRLIQRITFERWILSPENWIYFDWPKLADSRLRRLCELRQARWGDEWWTTKQVADHHGVDVKDVQRLAYRGELPAVQVAVSRGGRNKAPAWLNWYVKKSDALKVRFIKGRGGSTAIKFTPQAEAWMLKAYGLGWKFSEITRSMGNKCTSWTTRQHVFRLLREKGLTTESLNS
jgi:hypothetical protein